MLGLFGIGPFELIILGAIVAVVVAVTTLLTKKDRDD